MPEMKKVRYIGNKPKKTCTSIHGLEHISTVWNGKGDVQVVHESVARLLLQPLYRDIWEAADDEPLPTPRPAPTPPVGNAQKDGATGPAAATSDNQPGANPNAGEKEEPPPAQTEAEKRILEIVSVYPKLKDEDFNPNTQLPKLTVLTSLLGRQVTRAEAEAAHAAVQAHLAAREKAAGGAAGAGGVPE